MRRQRGLTMIESLVALLILSVVGLGAFTAFIGIFANYDSVQSANIATTELRQPIDNIADHLRNAQPVNVGGIISSVAVAEASRVSYYTGNGTETVTYQLQNGEIRRTVSGETATTLLSGVTSLTFRYWLAPSRITYYTESLTLGDPATMDVTGRASIAEIDIDVVATLAGVERRFSTKVRLRNSPDKRVL